MIMDLLDGGPAPKRGDIVQTNLGNRRERTWLVLHAREIMQRDNVTPIGQLTPRYDVWAVRWWELEVDFRMRLYRSAQRAGGQCVHYFTRYPAKKKRRQIAEWL